MAHLRDLAELRLLDASPCDTARLGAVRREDLRAVFESADSARAWSKDEAVIDRLQLPEMTGGINPGDRRAAYCLVLGLRVRSVLEIGTHIGCSTISMALALKRNEDALGRPCTMISVDFEDVNDETLRPWSAYGARESPRQMVTQLGCDHIVTFERSDSARYMRGCQKTFDLIFLDGSHAASAVFREMRLALRLLNPGGAILLHDYFPGLRPLWSDGSVISGPYVALRRLIAKGTPLLVHPLGALPWPTKLGSSVTSLALVSRAGERPDT